MGHWFCIFIGHLSCHSFKSNLYVLNFMWESCNVSPESISLGCSEFTGIWIYIPCRSLDGFTRRAPLSTQHQNTFSMHSSRSYKSFWICLPSLQLVAQESKTFQYLQSISARGILDPQGLTLRRPLTVWDVTRGDFYVLAEAVVLQPAVFTSLSCLGDWEEVSGNFAYQTSTKCFQLPFVFHPRRVWSFHGLFSKTRLYIYLYIYIYIHRHIYIYMYIYIYV